MANKPPRLRVVISRLQVVQPRSLIVIIPLIPERIDSPYMIIIAAVLRDVNPIRCIYTTFSPCVVIVSRNYTSLRVADSHDVPARSVLVMIYLRPVFHQPDHLLPFVHIPIHRLDSVFRHPFPQYPAVYTRIILVRPTSFRLFLADILSVILVTRLVSVRLQYSSPYPRQRIPLITSRIPQFVIIPYRLYAARIVRQIIRRYLRQPIRVAYVTA